MCRKPARNAAGIMRSMSRIDMPYVPNPSAGMAAPLAVTVRDRESFSVPMLTKRMEAPISPSLKSLVNRCEQTAQLLLRAVRSHVCALRAAEKRYSFES
jgi:hypothetical protein